MVIPKQVLQFNTIEELVAYLVQELQRGIHNKVFFCGLSRNGWFMSGSPRYDLDKLGSIYPVDELRGKSAADIYRQLFIDRTLNESREVAFSTVTESKMCSQFIVDANAQLHKNSMSPDWKLVIKYLSALINPVSFICSQISGTKNKSVLEVILGSIASNLTNVSPATKIDKIR
jgi:hypothetical protein